jgi:hypothetical protein
VRVRWKIFFYILDIHTEPRHVLSNVGRVASRDSSRTTATTDDLLVAFCEEDFIYRFFKSMKGMLAQRFVLFIQVGIKNGFSARADRAAVQGSPKSKKQVFFHATTKTLEYLPIKMCRV